MTSIADIIRLFQLATNEELRLNGPPNDNHTLKFKENLLNMTFKITGKGKWVNIAN